MKKTGFTFRPHEPAADGVRRIAEGLISVGIHYARSSSHDLEEAVHRFRTTTKRLRALLLMIEPVLTEPAVERIRARLKRAADRLASLRDRTIARETLQSLVESSASCADLLRVLDNEPGLGEAPSRDRLKAAGRDLAQFRREFKRLPIDGDDWSVIGSGLVESYRDAKRRMKAALTRRSDRCYHRWRIRVKQLNYQLEWLEPVWPKRIGKMLKRLHKLEEKLGADHDLSVVHDLLKQRHPATTELRGIERLQMVMAKRSRRLRRASAALGSKVLEQKARQFDRDCEQSWRAWKG